MKFSFSGFLCAAAAVAAFGAGEGGAGSPYGVTAHVSRWEFPTAERQMQLMRQAGIRWTRSDFDWSAVNPSPGKWDFSKLDQLLEISKRTGVRVLPILGYSSAEKIHPINALERWSDYCGRVAGRYREFWPAYEIWNEQNTSVFWGRPDSPEEYVKVLEAASRAIRATAPGAKVVYGGLAGTASDFLDKTLSLGAAKYCDAVAFHPYRVSEYPELSLPQAVDEVRAVLVKHGCPDMPLWCTEIGWSTPRRPEYLRELLPAALALAGVKKPAAVKAVVLRHDSTGIDLKGKVLEPHIIFPPFQRIDTIDYEALGQVNPREYPVLFASDGEAFPMRYLKDLKAYINGGGCVIFPSGLPLYYDIQPRENGTTWERLIQVDGKYCPELHIGWETWWTNSAVPKTCDHVEIAEEFRDKVRLSQLADMKTIRYLSNANLREKDRMIPLVIGGSGKYRAPVAALYQLNSADLRGNIIVFAPKAALSGCSELQQAQFLVRTYLILRARNVEKVWWYNFRAFEFNNTDFEWHYGIMYHTLGPKPAYRAYRTLTELCPEGATLAAPIPPDGERWMVAWRRPDGKKVHAVWSTGEPADRSFRFRGSLERVHDLFGAAVAVKPQGDVLQLPLSGSVIYVVGPEELSHAAPAATAKAN